jgi:hypothetical protein
MSILVLTSDTLIGTAAAGNIEYNGQFFATDSAASRAQVQRITQGTAVASTSGTSIDFTSLPAWVKKITVMFSGVSTNAANNLIVQLGTSSGFVSTGYLSSLASVNAGTGGNTNATNGFLASSSNAASVVSGTMTITNLTSNTWVYHAVTKSSTTVVVMAAGDISLAAALTQIRITDTAGTGTFDAGTINILYEG